MPKTISKNLILAALIICLSFAVSFPVLAQSPNTDRTYKFKDQSGLDTAANVAGYDIGTTNATSLEIVISSIVYTLLSLVGLLFLGLIIYGSYTWMTAGGNEEKVKKATKTVMSALFGLIITLSAYALSYFLISYFWQ